MLLLHGLGCSTQTWQRVAKRLARDYRVVALDLPGHGYSTTSDQQSMKLPDQARVVEQFMSAVGISRAALVGHSMGGGVAALVAAKHPQRVSKLALIDSVGVRYKPRLLARLMLTPRLGKLLMTRLTNRLFHALAVRLDAFANGKRYTEHDADVRYAHFNASPAARRAVFRAARASMEVGEIERSARDIRAKTLVLWGEKDRLVPIAVGHKLRDLISGARLSTLRGVGHETINEAPGRVARRLRRFLKDLR